MRRATVKRGLNFLIAAVALITVGSYYHAWVARLLFLSPRASAQFVSLAFFWGGMFGAIGILITIFGFLRPAGKEPRSSLLRPLLLFLGMVALFFYLFYSTLRSADEPPPLRPGETILI